MLFADHAPQDILQFFGAAQHARGRAAELHVEAPDRLEIEHRIEGRNLEHPDAGHAEKLGYGLDRLLRQPAARLPLRAPQDRDHRGMLTSGRIFRDLRFRPFEIGRREGKARRLFFGEPADAHRSISPKTMSSEPRIAETSASMWPRERKSMACRCGKLGARILHL